MPKHRRDGKIVLLRCLHGLGLVYTLFLLANGMKSYDSRRRRTRKNEARWLRRVKPVTLSGSASIITGMASYRSSFGITASSASSRLHCQTAVASIVGKEWLFAEDLLFNCREHAMRNFHTTNRKRCQSFRPVKSVNVKVICDRSYASF